MPLPKHKRISYKKCPLCRSTSFKEVHRADCSAHRIYHPDVSPLIIWMQCSSCEHVFTDGYFGAKALATLMGHSYEDEAVGYDIERQRHSWAPVVEKATELRGNRLGRWLDVGFLNGSAIFTAAEWGYQAVGIDLRKQAVKGLSAFGFEAHCVALSDYTPTEAFDVVSLFDVIEHMPFPGAALEHARTMLNDDGVVIISTPNIESIVWMALNQSGTNPYWKEIEHFHCFGRRALMRLLEQTGYEFMHYSIGKRFRAGMEIIARKK